MSCVLSILISYHEQTFYLYNFLKRLLLLRGYVQAVFVNIVDNVVPDINHLLTA